MKAIAKNGRGREVHNRQMLEKNSGTHWNRKRRNCIVWACNKTSIWFFLFVLVLIQAGCSKPQGENPVISFETTSGEIVVELDIASAPETVRNFVEYTNSGHYDGTIFHRVVTNSVIQTGGYDREMNEKLTRPPIRNESANGLLNKKYTLGMARTADPHSATSQFYINTKDNPEFDRDNARDKFGYCVFGKVIRGQDVVDKIGKVKTQLGGKNNDVPFETIEILKAKRIPKEKNG